MRGEVVHKADVQLRTFPLGGYEMRNTQGGEREEKKNKRREGRGASGRYYKGRYPSSSNHNNGEMSSSANGRMGG